MSVARGNSACLPDKTEIEDECVSDLAKQKVVFLADVECSRMTNDALWRDTMQKNQTELISEKDRTGKGILFCQMTLLGECDYCLKIRKSWFKVKQDRPGSQIEEINFMITTMSGTITIDTNFMASIYRKRNQLTLHLDEDFLLPICAFPTSPEQPVYNVMGRVVTQPVEYLDPFV
jgi:hypothetical protein